MTKRLRWFLVGVVVGVMSATRLRTRARTTIMGVSRRGVSRLGGDLRAAVKEGLRTTTQGKPSK